MSDCCLKKTSKITLNSCPTCGAKARSIKIKTLLHNVLFPDNLNISDTDYYFCASKNCDVGYFSKSSVITKQKLKKFEQWQQGWLCYCFDISDDDYKKAITMKNFQPIKDFVIQHTKNAQCACEVQNPSGQCCLARFKQLEKEYE